MNKSTIIIAFLAGILVGILAWNIVTINVTPVYADGQSTTNGYIAVTGMVSNNTDGLWVLDTRDSNRTPSLCLYIPEGGGRTLKLAGVRCIKYDHQLLEQNDNSEKKLQLKEVKNTIQEADKKLEEKRLKEEEKKAKEEAKKNKNKKP